MVSLQEFCYDFEFGWIKVTAPQATNEDVDVRRKRADSWMERVDLRPRKEL